PSLKSLNDCMTYPHARGSSLIRVYSNKAVHQRRFSLSAQRTRSSLPCPRPTSIGSAVRRCRLSWLATDTPTAVPNSTSTGSGQVFLGANRRSRMMMRPIIVLCDPGLFHKSLPHAVNKIRVGGRVSARAHVTGNLPAVIRGVHYNVRQHIDDR